MTSAQTDSLAGRRVLVTGAGGFIGSHLVERLIEDGSNVRALARYTSRGTAGFLDGSEVARHAEVVLADLRDPDAIRAATKDIDVVFHLGALIGIPYSYVHPQETVDTNVLGTLNVLLAARESGVGRIIHTSSSEVYGTAQSTPMSEAHPLHGQSPYAASKIAADQLAGSFHLSYGLPVVTLRPFNTYGPRQSARAVIPTVIEQGLRSEEIKLGNLGPKRDFTFVTDTVSAFVLAAVRDRAVGRTINLGTSQAVSIEDLVKLIGEILGKRLIPRTDPLRERPGGSEVEELLSDNSLARELLSWTPAVDLREGLTRTCDWVASHSELFSAGVYAI